MPASKYLRDDVYVSSLKNEHDGLVAKFKSKNDGMNDFLRTDALEYQRLDLGATYVLLDRKGEKLISYITLSMGALRIPERKEEFIFREGSLANTRKAFPSSFRRFLSASLQPTGTRLGGAEPEYCLNLRQKPPLMRGKQWAAHSSSRTRWLKGKSWAGTRATALGRTWKRFPAKPCRCTLR